MRRQNIFEGDSVKAQFSIITYRRLMSRRWVSFADIMADFLGKKSAQDLACNLSNCDNYSDLKKAVLQLRRELEVRAGDNVVEMQGNNRNRKFRYIGEVDDPLSDLQNERYIEDFKKYLQFCLDSAGFFPQCWLEYFFYGSRNLIDMKENKQQGRQFITASLNCNSRNIEHLPYLYDFIKNKQVISFDYKPYDEEIQHLIFHPHYLKEYNGRWHLYGHAEGRIPEVGYDIALDRIESKIREVRKIQYISPSKLYYENYFDKRVGVSRREDDTFVRIRVRAYSNNVFKLLETKRLHKSQTTVSSFEEHEDGKYGEFVLELAPNIEFIAQVLQMGPDLEVMEPKSLRDELAYKTKKMADLYLKDSATSTD